MLVYYKDEKLLVKDRLTLEDHYNNCKIFCWNYQKKEFLGRTKESWLKICLFYFCFFIGLGIFFTSCVVVHMATLDLVKPEYYNNYSVMNQQYIDGKHVGISPGLGFRPHINPVTSLIRVKSSASNLEHPHNFRQYAEQLEEFLKNNFYQLESLINFFGPDNPCNRDRHFEYDKAKPCVLLKLNKIYDWIPQAFESSDPLPNELKPYEDLVRMYPENVFVICEGENPVDKDLIGNIKYYSVTPDNGPGEGPIGFLPFSYYPYKLNYGNDWDLTNYYAPLIFAYFPEITTNVLVNVMCKAFAKNIHVNTLYRAGSVHFELIIE
jgi:sodium/potassium-transporting ATPase subunit beta